MKLYDAAASGNCHKVRMLLSMLQLEHEVVAVKLADLQQKSPAHLARNPLGTVPVLEDGDITIYDSQAILVYLARQYGGAAWLPVDAAGQGAVQQWLSYAANEIWNGPAFARAKILFNRDVDLPRAQAAAVTALNILEGHLAHHDWLALDHPTIADLACYPYTALAKEGGVDLAPFQAVGAWFKRIEALPGYVGMAGLP